MPGVVDHGLFVGLAHTVIVGRGEGTVVIER
jgi:ribose 5-phosphate isomerase